MLRVPMPNGNDIAIDNLSVDTPKETLGVYTCPSGKADSHIKAIKDKVQEWIDRAEEVHLSRQDVWFLLYHQLWLKLGYALDSLSAP